MVPGSRWGLLRIAGVLLFTIGFSTALQAGDSALSSRALQIPAPPQAQARPQATNHPPQGHVLLLYSNVYGLPAHRKNSDAFLRVLEAAGVSPTTVHYEYLDLIRNNTQAYRRHLPDWLREKYARAVIAVIITVDGAAQDFMLEEGRDLFAQAPIISVLSPKRLQDPVPGRRIIQIPAEADFSGTLKVAIELFPTTRHVFFVVGDSEDEKQWLALAQQVFAPWAGTLRIEFTNTLNHAEMLRRAAAFPSGGIVFYLSFYRDKDGQPFVPRAVAAEVLKVAANPTFGIYDGLMGAGIIGGSLFSYEAEGEHSGQLARDILAGKLTVNKPLTILPCLHKAMFDWKQLERWGVSKSALPAGSVVVNRPMTIWEEHKWKVIVAVGGLLLQTSLIALLLIQGRLKRRAEAELGRMVERYDLAARAAHLAVWDWDVTGDYLVWDERMFELYGGEREDFPGTSEAWLQRVHPEDRTNWQEATRQALAGERELDTAFQVQRPDGEVRILIVYGKVVRDSQGRPLRMTGINYDITEQRRSDAALHQQLSRLSQLNQITRAIAERHESESMVRVVLKQLVMEFPVAAALVAHFDREAALFTVKVQESRARPGADVSTWAEGVRIPIDETGLRICLSGETLLVRDLAAGDSALDREFARYGYGSLIAAPLVAGEPIFGILVVLRSEPDWFSASEVEFMRQLRAHLALAMQQAQLYENLRVAYDELKTTQRVVMQQERLRALGQMSSGITHDVNNALSPIVMNTELILLRKKLQRPEPAVPTDDSTGGERHRAHRGADTGVLSLAGGAGATAPARSQCRGAGSDLPDATALAGHAPESRRHHRGRHPIIVHTARDPRRRERAAGGAHEPDPQRRRRPALRRDDHARDGTARPMARPGRQRGGIPACGSVGARHRRGNG